MKKSNLLLLTIPMLALPLSLFSVTLEDVVNETLNDNPIVQKELSNYKSANYELDSSYSGYKPTLDLTGGIGIEKTKRENTTASTTIDEQLLKREVGIKFRENLFEGFYSSSNIEEKKQKLIGARYIVLQVANSLALTTAEAYLQVSYQKDLLDLLKENVQTHERIFKMIRQKAESGIGRRSDIEQTEGRVTLAYSNYIAQLRNYQTALITFEKIYSQSLMGSEITKPKLPLLPSDSLEVLESIASQYSPSLLIEEANIAASKANYSKSKSNYYPKIWTDLSAQWNNNMSGVQGESDSYQAMLRGSFNIYNGGSDEANRLIAMQGLNSYKSSYEDQTRNVYERLRQSFMSEEILRYQIKCLQRHTELSKQTAESYAKEFQLGRRNLLDLLNVELEYNSAKQQLLAARNEQYLARYSIFEALGLLPYVLHSDIYEVTNSTMPEDIELLTQNLNSLHLKGEISDFIDLNSICEGAYDPIEKEEPIVEEEVIEEPIVEEVALSAVVANDIEELKASEDASDNKKKTVVMDSVFFAYKSTELAEEAKKHLKYVADFLKSQDGTALIVYGHSDSIGSAKYNQKLSLERATNVKKELVKLGISPSKIDAIGVGETQPIADNSTVAGREKNRRIEFEITREKDAPKLDANTTKNIEKNTTKTVSSKFDEKFDLKVSKEPLEEEPKEKVEKETHELSPEEVMRLQTEADIQRNIELEMSEDDIEVQ